MTKQIIQQLPDMQQPATLYVDLDGTLIQSDLLLESFLALLKKNPFYLMLMPFWLLRGKAALKAQIARRVNIRADLLPYNEKLLRHLDRQKSKGRRLVLISASDQRLVQAVATHLELFDDVAGSQSGHNLSGKQKLAYILDCENGAPFDYAGNAMVDLVIWQRARQALAVNTTAATRRRLERLHNNVRAGFDGARTGPRAKAGELLRAMRPHQWLKNLLLFLPLLLVQQYDSTTLLTQTMLAFICFSLCASSVYLLNDLLDLPADRQHPSKRHRPFAAGKLSLGTGLVVSPVLLAASVAIAIQFLPIYFLMVLGLYYVTTLLYSFLLKQVVLVDVIVLGALYTLRIIAGAAAIPVIPSFWLLAFSMFLFMSLAIVKRFTELSWLRDTGIRQSANRGYLARDLDIMSVFGSSSGFLAVLVFALYINSEDIRLQYTTPEILWLICPLLLYLISRIWLLAWRGELDDDPVVFALRDRISQFVVLTGTVLVYLAHLDWREMVQGVL